MSTCVEEEILLLGRRLRLAGSPLCSIPSGGIGNVGQCYRCSCTIKTASGPATLLPAAMGSYSADVAGEGAADTFPTAREGTCGGETCDCGAVYCSLACRLKAECEFHSVQCSTDYVTFERFCIKAGGLPGMVWLLVGRVLSSITARSVRVALPPRPLLEGFLSSLPLPASQSQCLLESSAADSAQAQELFVTAIRARCSIFGVSDVLAPHVWQRVSAVLAQGAVSIARCPADASLGVLRAVAATTPLPPPASASSVPTTSGTATAASVAAEQGNLQESRRVALHDAAVATVVRATCSSVRFSNLLCGSERSSSSALFGAEDVFGPNEPLQIVAETDTVAYDQTDVPVEMFAYCPTFASFRHACRPAFRTHAFRAASCRPISDSGVVLLLEALGSSDTETISALPLDCGGAANCLPLLALHVPSLQSLCEDICSLRESRTRGCSFTFLPSVSEADLQAAERHLECVEAATCDVSTGPTLAAACLALLGRSTALKQIFLGARGISCACSDCRRDLSADVTREKERIAALLRLLGTALRACALTEQAVATTQLWQSCCVCLLSYAEKTWKSASPDASAYRRLVEVACISSSSESPASTCSPSLYSGLWLAAPCETYSMMAVHCLPLITSVAQDITSAREPQAVAYARGTSELKDRGASCFRSGDIGGALQCYREALSRYPSDPVLLSNVALCEFRSGSVGAAFEAAIRCVANAPLWPKAYFRAASCSLRMMQYDACLEYSLRGAALLCHSPAVSPFFGLAAASAISILYDQYQSKNVVPLFTNYLASLPPEARPALDSAPPVRVQYLNGERYMIATRTCEMGSVLFVEEPLFSVPATPIRLSPGQSESEQLVALVSAIHSRCDHCARPLNVDLSSVRQFSESEAALWPTSKPRNCSCTLCPVAWCSDECERKAKAYHAAECGPVAVALELWLQQSSLPVPTIEGTRVALRVVCMSLVELHLLASMSADSALASAASHRSLPTDLNQFYRLVDELGGWFSESSAAAPLPRVTCGRVLSQFEAGWIGDYILSPNSAAAVAISPLCFLLARLSPLCAVGQVSVPIEEPMRDATTALFERVVAFTQSELFLKSWPIPTRQGDLSTAALPCCQGFIKHSDPWYSGSSGSASSSVLLQNITALLSTRRLATSIQRITRNASYARSRATSIFCSRLRQKGFVEAADALCHLSDEQVTTLSGASVGLCSLVSCINHSCAPNVHVSLAPSLTTDVESNCCGPVLLAVANRDIMAGECLSHNYLGSDAEAMDALARRTRLKEAYYFECRCEKCRVSR